MGNPGAWRIRKKREFEEFRECRVFGENIGSRRIEKFGKGHIREFGVPGDWGIQEIRKTGRFGAMRKFPNVGKISWDPGGVRDVGEFRIV